MTIEMRPVTLEEYPTFARTAGAAFGERPADENIARWQGTFESARSLAVFEDGRMVATAGRIALELTLPGGGQVPVAGISGVGVLPTHRRQGHLTRMMRQMLIDARARGERLAALTASESVIYGRFGFGVATSRMNFEIEPRRADLARVPEAAGRLRLATQDEAQPALQSLYERVRLQRPGAVSRTPDFWTLEMLRPGNDPGPRFFALYEADSGEIEGAAYYRIQAQWVDNLAQSTLHLGELHAITPTARAALWRYCLSVDLVQKVRAVNRPVDEPLRWLLADPRRLRVTAINDDLWLRLLDIPGALSARRYAGQGRLIFAVADTFLPENAGTYALDCETDGATCHATDAAPDLALDSADLAAVYLGGVRFATLAEAGRIEERAPEALARADALFASEATPYSGTPF